MRETLPTKLYKYRGGCFDRDFRALSEDYLWAASPSELNDPFEVTVVLGEGQIRTIDLLTFSGLQSVAPSFGDRLLGVLRHFVETVRGWGIYSLSSSPTDELSWAHYADSHRGFCIEYSSARLLQRNLQAELVLGVAYHDEPPVINLTHVMNDNAIRTSLSRALVATKSKAWQHEGEWRIVTGTPGRKDYDFRAVEAIYFGFRMPEQQRKVMRKTLERRGIAFYQMQPIPRSYKLQPSPVPSTARTSVTYKYKVSPVEDGVPYLDSYLKSRPGFVDLIRKAIEVVRREPYCEKVIDVYESGSKSSPEEPVFYVTCEDHDGKRRNYDLSKAEIEHRFAEISDLQSV